MIGPKFYAWDKNGKPLAFGKLYTYQARTNTPKPTYQSEDQQVENSNPVILNGEGYANVYLSGSYKMVLKDSDENEIWSSDPVTASELSEWGNCVAPIYLTPTQFKVAGNFTDTYDKGRRVRVNNNTANYSYSTIDSSVFAGGETTVVLLDPVVTTGVIEICSSTIGVNSAPFVGDNVGEYTDLVFNTNSEMVSGITIGGKSVSYKEGMALKVNNSLGTYFLYTVVTEEADYDLGGGLWAKSVSPENVLSSAFSEETKVFDPREVLFAFHFDGPYITNFEALLDKADELGVPVCIGSINDLTNGAVGGQNENPNFGYVGQLVDAQRRGHEIYNHGFSSGLDLSPGSNVSENLQNFWINYSHEWLQSLGINAQMWVTSNGKPVIDQTPHLDPKYIPKILERHSVAFGRTSSPWNDVNGFKGASYGADTPVNQEGLTRANIEGVSQAQIEEFVDWCIDNNRVAVFAGHDSGNSGQLTVAEFEAAVNYIHSKGKRVSTSQDVFASFTNLFTDDAKTAKAANIASLENKSVIQENLLENTDLTTWLIGANPNFGTAVLSSFGGERGNGEQFALAVTDPLVTNSTYDLKQIINRPFNTNDVATLCFALEASANDLGSFGIECIAQFYDSENATGNEIAVFRRGISLTDSVAFQMIFADGTNFFTYNNVQSVKLTYQIANKTTWSGTRTLNLFNPRFNRGNIPASFFKKRNPSILWKGNVGDVGAITLDHPADGGQFIKVEVGVNNTNNDVRGSDLFAYNIHDKRTIRAWSNVGGTYTDFEVRFNSPTELEIVSENAVGGGDFAVIGVYKY